MTDESEPTFFGEPVTKAPLGSRWDSPWGRPFHLYVSRVRRMADDTELLSWSLLVQGEVIPHPDMNGFAATLEECCRNAEDSARQLVRKMREQVKDGP